MFDIFKMKQKHSRFSSKAGTKQLAKEMRGDKTEEEWQAFLEDVAEKQVNILNTLIQYEGPSNLTFQVSVVTKK